MVQGARISHHSRCVCVCVYVYYIHIRILKAFPATFASIVCTLCTYMYFISFYLFWYHFSFHRYWSGLEWKKEYRTTTTGHCIAVQANNRSHRFFYLFIWNVHYGIMNVCRITLDLHIWVDPFIYHFGLFIINNNKKYLFFDTHHVIHTYSTHTHISQ